MVWLLVAAGLMISLLGVILAYTFFYKHSQVQSYSRLSYPHKIIPLLRMLARADDSCADISALQSDARIFMLHLTRLQHALKQTPALPAEPNGEPRLMELCRDQIDDGDISTQALSSALENWSEAPTSRECRYFPQAIAAAEAHRLQRILEALCYDLKDRRSGRRLASQLMKTNKPERLLAHCSLNTMGISAFLHELQEQDQHQLLAMTDAWLDVKHLTAKDILITCMNRQMQLAEEIRRARSCFDALDKLNWSSHCADADSIHHLLLEEPSGSYADMTQESQLSVRLQLETASLRFNMDPVQIIREAFILCHESEDGTPESHVSYYLLDPVGLTALQRLLPTRRGCLYARLSKRPAQVRYGILLGFSFVAGLTFLQLGQPVFMLPFFLVTIGCVPRTFHFPAANLLCTAVSPEDPDLSTLVVVHAEISNTHDAIQAVRRLKTIRHTVGISHDYLLLGDFSPAITAMSGNDAPIIQTVMAALSALHADRVYYLQRGRSWDSSSHCYRARAGGRGATDEICRLIAQGECADTIAFSTLEPSALERRYAYVLAVPAGCTPAPDMLPRLLEAMAHPMNQQNASGSRGHALLLPECCNTFCGLGLIRPDAYLEATAGFVSNTASDEILCGKLAHAIPIKGAHAQLPREGSAWEDIFSRHLTTWRLFRWQLPWVQTPSGFISNPLRYLPRFQLRENIRSSVLSACRLILLLWAVLTENWLLLSISLLAPEAGHPLKSRDHYLNLLCRWCLIPSAAAVEAAALLQGIWRKPIRFPEWSIVGIWAQCITAALTAALGFVRPDFFLPGLFLAALFSAFPLAYRYLSSAEDSREPLNAEDLGFVRSIMESSWRFFTIHVIGENRHLPPCVIQPEPDIGPSPFTSPEAIGSYLLSCLCAKETGCITADEAANRILLTVRSAAKLPRPHGVLCRRYQISTGAAADAGADAAGNGFFLAALMTAAQALRAWLPELSSDYTSISAEISGFVSSIDLSRLYDPDTGYFFQTLDADGHGKDHVLHYADAALLLCAAACARKDVPFSLLHRLSHTSVRFHGLEVPCSGSGAASDHLLPALFLPLDEDEAQAFVYSMLRTGRSGFFGQDKSCYFSFDSALRHRTSVFGIPELALEAVTAAPVFAPHAAALGLPHSPQLAIQTLRRYQDAGAFSLEGFCDAVDLEENTVCVRTLDAYHQGLTMISASYLLADEPIRRYFCDIPEIEALLPLLRAPKNPLRLPLMPRYRKPSSKEIFAERLAFPLTEPADMQILGADDFHLIGDANGSCTLYAHSTPLTSGVQAIDGPQYYLVAEGRMTRLGAADPAGKTFFAPGEIRCEQICGSIRAEIVATLDLPRQRSLHTITLTNLSTKETLVDLASFVRPAMNDGRISQPDKHHLVCQTNSLHLHHTMNLSHPPLLSCVCTDMDSFLGRAYTLHNPALLKDDPVDIFHPSLRPCLSFRARLQLAGRGQICIWFTTGLGGENLPALSALPGIRKLASLQHRAIEDSAGLSHPFLHTASLLNGLTVSSGFRLAVELDEGIDALDDLLNYAGSLLMRGLPAELCIIRDEKLADTVSMHLKGHYAESCISTASPDTFSASRWPVVLHANLHLKEQIKDLYRSIQPPSSPKAPLPAFLPEKSLRRTNHLCGFDPETGDLVLQLLPEMTTPVPWRNPHCTPLFHEFANDSEINESFREQVFLCMADGTLITPWSPELPRAVHYKPDETNWETWSDSLDIKLTAFPMPGHSCGVRILRVRNVTDKPIRLTVYAAAKLGKSPECFSGIALEENGFLAGNGWIASRTADFTPYTTVPALDAPDFPEGPLARLKCQMQLPANASAKAAWLSGSEKQSEQIAAALSTLEQHSAVNLHHQLRSIWAKRLDLLNVVTPEDTFNLFFNHVLSVQLWHAPGISAVPALIYLDPDEAKSRLLHAAGTAAAPADWSSIALLLERYVHIRQDAAVLDAPLSSAQETIYTCCRDALLSVPLDRHHMPEGNDSLRLGLMIASAAQALNALREDPALSEFQRTLLTAADLRHWQNGHYGSPLRLDIQNFAAHAYGNTLRTRQSLSACWDTLYDQPHGLLRLQLPDESAHRPGSPLNGGMITLDAVQALRSLLKLGLRREALELLSALNPLHHTDTPARQEAFQLSPHRLHGGMLASPLPAGQAVFQGGDEAAALLHAVILEDVLGFHREGTTIRIIPCIPPDWDGYTIRLQEGASTWRISMERRLDSLTIDGEEKSGDAFTIHDDGKIHRVRVPLK